MREQTKRQTFYYFKEEMGTNKKTDILLLQGGDYQVISFLSIYVREAGNTIIYLDRPSMDWVYEENKGNTKSL